jgi:uroporphyrinogen decarboxylase
VVLKREFGKDIVFFGGIDENVILATGTEEEVRSETRRIIDILGSDGRYIVAASHDYLLPEVPAVNICAMFDEARKYSGKNK